MRVSSIPTPTTTTDIETLFEPADVGRVLNCVSATVHRLTDRRLLIPVARTVRGVRLYRPADVAALQRERERLRRG